MSGALYPQGSSSTAGVVVCPVTGVRMHENKLPVTFEPVIYTSGPSRTHPVTRWLSMLHGGMSIVVPPRRTREEE